MNFQKYARESFQTNIFGRGCERILGGIGISCSSGRGLSFVNLGPMGNADLTRNVSADGGIVEKIVKTEIPYGNSRSHSCLMSPRSTFD